MLNNLKSQYENGTEDVSTDLWARLENELNDNRSTTIISENKISFYKRPIFWASAIIVLIFSNTIIIYFSQEKTKLQPLVIEKTIITAQPKNDTRKITVFDSKTGKSTTSKKIQGTNIQETETPDIVLSKNETNFGSQVIEPSKADEIKLVENDKVIPTKPKYVTSQDLLFGVELDKTRKIQADNQNSKLGMTDYNKHLPHEINDDRLSPKSIKILGFTIFDKDSVTKK